MNDSNKKHRPSPLNIKSLKNRLATEHHRIDNMVEIGRKKENELKR